MQNLPSLVRAADVLAAITPGVTRLLTRRSDPPHARSRERQSTTRGAPVKPEVCIQDDSRLTRSPFHTRDDTATPSPYARAKSSVSPFADSSGPMDAEHELAAAGHSVPVEPSDLASRARFIPTAEELKRLGL